MSETRLQISEQALRLALAIVALALAAGLSSPKAAKGVQPKPALVHEW